jgi:hypothetical protein
LDSKASAKNRNSGRTKVTKVGTHRRAKVTLYIRQDQIEAIEEIQLNERKRTGKKPDKQDLIQEAVDMLIKAHGLTKKSLAP